MGRMQIVFPDHVEQWLRETALKKGDISLLVTEAVIKFHKIPKQQREPIEPRTK